jgi:adenylate cyclase
MNYAPLVSLGRTPFAILCADVHGYSRLMARNEEGTHERVSRSIRLVKSLISEYGGWVANVAGDGLVALFESSSQALQFAFAIQREFRDAEVCNADDEPVAFRIGINLGRVFFDEGNVQGHSVNVAARIQTLARPGGICITDVVQRAASDSVAGRLRPLGLKYLKNIDEPVEVFAIDIDAAEPAESALVPPVPGSSRPTVFVEAFEAVSGSHDETCHALAVSESLTQALSRFNWLAVKEDPRSGLVLRNLGNVASHVLEGNGGYVVAGRITRAQRNLRLIARLREHPGGRIIWSSAFDLRGGRTFKRLDELATILAARLDRQILAEEVAKVWQKPLDGLDAHDCVTRAIPLMFQMSRESLRKADQLLRAADEGQPRCSRNRAMRAFAALLGIGQQWVSDPRAAAENIDWLTRSAIEYSPTDALALSLRGHVESFIFHRFDHALDYFERAVQSNPSEPVCWAFSAVTLSYLGRTREAMGRLHRYRKLCPLDTYPFYFDTAFTLNYALAGEYDKAVQIGRRVVAENPNYFAAYRPLITSLARTGAVDEARDLLEKLLANEPQFSIGWFRSKYPPLPRDQFEHYLKGFREVGVPED